MAPLVRFIPAAVKNLVGSKVDPKKTKTRRGLRKGDTLFVVGLKKDHQRDKLAKGLSRKQVMKRWEKNPIQTTYDNKNRRASRVKNTSS